MISNDPMGKLLWVCIVLFTLTFVTSFNLPDRDPAGSKNATTPATDLNATTVASNSSDFNSTGDGSLDDRFNFNLNLAGARGQNRYGGSQSDSLSYGVNSGIRRPGGQIQNLYSNSGSKSNSFSYGHGAPLTYANTGTRHRPGYGYGGNAAAGIHGGRGNSYAQSINQNIEIPLDNRGTVFFSNLKERDNGTSTEASSSSTPSTSLDKSSTSVSPVTDTNTITSTISSGKKVTDSLIFS